MIPADQTYSKEGRAYVKSDYFKYLAQQDLLIDVSAGGLIYGPSLAQGGTTLFGCNSDSEFFIAGQAEGWQFLVNAFAEFENREAITPLTRYAHFADLLFVPYAVPSHINVFDARPRNVNGQLITPALFFSTNQISVIPKVSVKPKLTFLDTINREAWLKHYIEKQPEGTIRDSAAIARLGPSSGNN